MQQQMTHEMLFRSDRALLITGVTQSGPSNNEDQVQRVMCDWAFKGLLNDEMRGYINALPEGIATIVERNKFGRSHVIMANKQHLITALAALDAGELIPTEYK